MSEYRDNLEEMSERQKLIESFRRDMAALREERDQAAREARKARGEYAELYAKWSREKARDRRWNGKLVFLSLLGIAAIGGSIFLVKACADAIPPPPPLTAGWVVGRNYTPEHTTTSTTQVGKVPVTTTTNHPADWDIIIADGNQLTEIDVTHEQYDDARLGTWFCEGWRRCVPPMPYVERW